MALAAEAHELPGETMSLWWALPFAGLLLSIATGPLLFHHVWEHHYGKITAFWAALVVVPLAIAFGIGLGERGGAACAAHRIHVVHHSSVCAVHDFGRHPALPATSTARRW